MTHPIIRKKNKLASKTLKSAIVALTALGALTMQQASLAADSGSGAFFGTNAPGKWIIGGKVAKVDANIADEKDADAAGIVLGYEFARAIGSADGSSTIEFEYITGDASIPTLGLNYDVDVANIFFTYRSAGTLYYKLKGGLSYADFQFSDSTFGNSDLEEVGLAFGVGLGYRVGDLGVVELEYSGDTSDADLSILAVNALLEF